MAQKNVESLEHIPPSEHGAGFPPFAKETFASQLLWLVIVFVALYLLMARVALPRVGAILESRRVRIDQDLAEANRLKGESDEAIAVYEKSLADARNRAQTLANETRERFAHEAEAARKQLDASLNEKIAAAEHTIAERRAAAMAGVHAIAVDAAGAVVERLIGATPSQPEVEAAVADALKG